MKLMMKLVFSLFMYCSCFAPQVGVCNATLIGDAKNVKPAFPRNNVTIIFACDDNYAFYTGVAIFSLISNVSSDQNYDIWILDGGIAQHKREAVAKLADQKTNISIRFFDIKEYASKYKTTLYDAHHKHLNYNIATYYRLFIPLIFGLYSKVVYLDSDIVVNGDVAPLFNTDLKGQALGGAVEQYDFWFLVYHNKITKGKWRNYYNAGVLVMDIKKCASLDLFNKCINYISSNKKLIFPDQDALNANVKATIIDQGWNMFPSIMNRYSIRDIKIVHYIGIKKPWGDCTAYCNRIWVDYAEESPFANALHAALHPNNKGAHNQKPCQQNKNNVSQEPPKQSGFMKWFRSLRKRGCK